MAGDAEVRDNPTELRYELVLDGDVAGFILYRRRRGAVALVHTDIAPRLEGRGLGATLVAGALDDIRAHDLHVVPICPFVRAFLERHPDYADLVVADDAVPE
jgi:predicted GNAT family acetyltransferase